MGESARQMHIRDFLLLAVDPSCAHIHAMGWDTERTGRERINFLKSPVELVLKKDQSRIRPNVAFRSMGDYAIGYELVFPQGIRLAWDISLGDRGIDMRFSCSGDLGEVADSMELLFPFDPAVAVASVISSRWSGEGQFLLPAVISVPDLGQMRVDSRSHPSLSGRCSGSRTDRWINVAFELPLISRDGALDLAFEGVVLVVPEGFRDEGRWRLARRGWFNFIQLSCGASGGSGDVIGVWANNTLSDPVSSVVFMLGDCTLLVPELAPGVSMAPILKRTLDYWLDFGTSWDGNIAYTAAGTAGYRKYSPQNRFACDPAERINSAFLMDTNPAILIGAWCYIKATHDLAWLQDRMEHLEFLSDYMENRDIDGDGLIESRQSGNAGSRPPRSPDSAWDCYCSGHKNAYVNILAFRAWKCLADLENLLGNEGKRDHYLERSRRIKASFMKELYNPETGWMGAWRSLDGVLHDIHTDVVTSLAVDYGLLDIGQGRPMLRKFMDALDKTGFRRFDLGLPLNIRPVPPEEMEHPFEFQHFLNGGCGVSNTAWSLDALYMVGMGEEADRILQDMLLRQWEGCFPNGGGFQNGFVDRMGEGAEVYDWNGKPEGYEGHLVYCWGFLHSLLLREPSLRRRLHQPIDSGPCGPVMWD